MYESYEWFEVGDILDDSDAAVAGGDADADVEDPSKEEDVEEVFFFRNMQNADCTWSPLIVSLHLRLPFHCQAWVKTAMDLLGTQFESHPGFDAAPLKYGSDCSGIDAPWWSLRMLQSAINAPCI